MHRFYMSCPLEPGKSYPLSKEEAHHASKVLRLRIGDEVELLDGQCICSAKITEIDRQEVSVLCLMKKPSVEPQTRITLYQGFPKGDKLYYIVQKCTEIGVHAIVPIVMERCVKKNSNVDKVLEKCQKLSIEACKQCGRGHVPPVEDILSFVQSLKRMQRHDLLLVPWEEETQQRLNAMIQRAQKGMDIGIVIGPEGGISAAEMSALTALGAQSVTFGKRILRTETAGMCAIFAILSGLND